MGWTVDVLIARIAAHGLRSRAPHGWPDAPLDDGAWDELLARVRSQRLTGFLAWALEDGFPATAAQRRQADEAHAEMLTACLQLERMLLEVSDELLADEIEFRVLKGPALGRWVYPDPAVRTFGDIDLLISSADWDQTSHVLRAAGLHGSYGEPGPGWARRFAKGDVFRTDAGWELDLHRTFVGGPLGLSLDLAAVFADPSLMAFGGAQLPVLPPDTAFLHACYNLALADLRPRLVAARDVAQLLLHGSVDLERVQELARTSKAEAVVARAVRVSGELLEEAELPLSAWAHRHRPRLRERAALFAYTDPGRNTPRETVLGLLAVPGWRPKLEYVWPLLFPQRSYLGERHDSRRARFRYAANRLRPGRRAGR